MGDHRAVIVTFRCGSCRCMDADPRSSAPWVELRVELVVGQRVDVSPACGAGALGPAITFRLFRRSRCRVPSKSPEYHARGVDFPPTSRAGAVFACRSPWGAARGG